jgi:HEAT repeat protein
MRKPRLLIAVIVLVTIGAGLLVNDRLHREPVYQGRKVSYWVNQLNNGDDNAVREKAIEAMRELGPRAIPYLTIAPRREDTRLMAAGKSVYRIVAPYVSREIRNKLPLRPSHTEIVGSGAALALGKMGPKARSAVPTLLKWLDDPDSNICNSAFIALLQIGADDDQVINALLKKLKGASGFTRTMLLVNPAGHYDEIDPHAVAAISLLTYGFKSDNAYVRMRAARALGKFGTAAEQLKPELEIALDDPSLEVRTGAAIGLWRFDGRLEPTLKILNEALQSKSTRWEAVAGLAEIGSPARDSLVLLVPLLQGTPPFFRANVSNAIQRIDPQTAEQIFREASSAN